MATNSQEKTLVDSQDPETRCPGDKVFQQCDAAVKLFEQSRSFTPDRHLWAADEKGRFNRLLFMEVGCHACKQVCIILVEMSKRSPTDRAQVECKNPDARSDLIPIHDELEKEAMLQAVESP